MEDDHCMDTSTTKALGHPPELYQPFHHRTGDVSSGDQRQGILHGFCSSYL